VLGGSADHHYGFSYTMPEPIDVKKFMPDVKEGRIKFDTTEQERAERAKVPFAKFGSTFNSREEITEVCQLLEERHGKENPDEGEVEKLIAGLQKFGPVKRASHSRNIQTQQQRLRQSRRRLFHFTEGRYRPKISPCLQDGKPRAT
jgi:hypothetical protein